MPLQDLPLNEPRFPQIPRRGPQQGSPTRLIVLGAFAIVVGSLLALWWMSRRPVETVTPAPTPPTDVAMGTSRPRQQPVELPALDASDTWLAQLVGALSRHPLIVRLIAAPDLVRTAVLVVEQIGDGRTPAGPLRELRPTSRLTIFGTDAGRIDPRSYARWDSATASLVSINPADAAQIYVNAKALFDQAYRALGHPKGDFDNSIVRAINTLATTPQPSGDLELLRRPGYFEHADPSLRGILPVQKQMLLIGPANRQKVMSWLRRFAAGLDLKIEFP